MTARHTVGTPDLIGSLLRRIKWDRDDGVSIDIRVFGIVEDSGMPPRPLDPSHPVHECVKALCDKCNLTIYPPPTLY